MSNSEQTSAFDHGREAFLRGQGRRPWIAGCEILSPKTPTVEWMEGFTQGWDQANLRAPVCMGENDAGTKILNRAGMSPIFAPLSKPGAHVSSRTINSDLMEITEDVPGFVVYMGAAAAGITIGPFASEESAKKHGEPRHCIWRRRRFVRGGEVVEGSPTALQFDENDPTTEMAG